MDMKFIIAALLRTPIDANNTKNMKFHELEPRLGPCGRQNIFGA
jgi:hypothetical protein